MTALFRRVLALLMVCAVVMPSAVQAAEDNQVQRQQVQPLNNAPVWREVRSGDAHSTQVQGIETGVLIQSAGETWRELRNGPISLYGGALLLAVPFLILGVYFAKGPVRLRGKLTGRMIQRFNSWERVVHWSMALSWLVLAITGILILFGKHFLLPVVGYSAFGFLLNIGKPLHNFIGPLFLVSALAFFVTFVRRNIPDGNDFAWLGKLGGLLSKDHPPSGFFNGGEKVLFWVIFTLFGIVVSLSGLVLNFPNFEQGRAIMQNANVIHAIGSIIFMAAIMGHIYMGTVGVEGAYKCMRHDGLVDETWAQEHHALWYQEVKGQGAGQGAGQAPAAGSKLQHST